MEDKDIIDLYWQRNDCAIEESDRKYGHYCHTIQACSQANLYAATAEDFTDRKYGTQMILTGRSYGNATTSLKMKRNARLLHLHLKPFNRCSLRPTTS